MMMPDDWWWSSSTPLPAAGGGGGGGGGPFATWDPAHLGAQQTLSSGNLTTTLAGPNVVSSTLATSGQSTGKFYYEVTVNSSLGFTAQAFGLAAISFPLTDSLGTDAGNVSLGWRSDGTVQAFSIVIATIQGWTVGDTISIAVDFGGSLIWFRTNGGNWNNSGAADPATGVGGISFSLSGSAFFPATTLQVAGDQWTANFGASAYAFTIPAGFANWPATLFDPSTLTGLIAWYKGDAGLTLSGSDIVSWNDQSGGGFVQTPIGGLAPTVVATLNGLNTVTFSRSGSGLTSSTGATFNTLGTTISIFMVARCTAGTSRDEVCAFTNLGDPNSFSTVTSAIPLFLPSDTSIQAYRNLTGLSNGTTGAAGTWFELGSIFDGTNNTVYINGAAQTPVASSGSFGSACTLSLGSELSNGGPFGGQIAEVIVTNTVISSTDRANIQSYFSTKWGV